MLADPLRRLKQLREQWRDPSMTMLLAVQCLTIFGLVPAAAVGLSLPSDVAAVLQLTFMSFTILMARHSWTPWAGLGTLLLAGLGPVLRGQYRGVDAIGRQ